METQNPFTNCKLVAVDFDDREYHKLNDAHKRGELGFVMSRGALQNFASCQSRWKAGYEHKDTDATDYGSRRDCQTLSPERFDDRYVVAPATYPATKTSTAVKAGECQVGDPIPWNGTATFSKDWKKAQGDKEIVDAQDINLDGLAIDALHRDERIRRLLVDSDRQVYVTGEFHDPATGLVIPVKTLIDLAPKRGTKFEQSLADYKTARTAALGLWPKVVDERWYDAQAAMALWLYNAATGEDRTGFYHAIQENVAPWQTARRLLSAEIIERGRRKVASWLANYAQCVASNHWPDYDDASQFDGWSIVEPTNNQIQYEPVIPSFEFVKKAEPAADFDVGHRSRKKPHQQSGQPRRTQCV